MNEWKVREFPGGPVVRTLCFHCRGHGFDPWTKIPHAPWHGQEKKKRHNKEGWEDKMFKTVTILQNNDELNAIAIKISGKFWEWA